MATLTGLRWLFQAVRQGFATEGLSVSTASGGTASVTASVVAGNAPPAGGAVVAFTAGGTVGTAGAAYTVAITGPDGTVTTSGPTALGTSSTITVTTPWGTVSISLGAGTLLQGQTITVIPGPVSVVFGDCEPAKQINQGLPLAQRVVFAPGLGADGLEGGVLVAPRAPGDRDPDSTGDVARPLADNVVGFRIFCWGADTSDLDDAALQTDVALLLHADLVRIILEAWPGIGAGHTLEEMGWRWAAQPSNVRALGREIVDQWKIRVPVPASETTLAHPTLNENITHEQMHPEA